MNVEEVLRRSAVYEEVAVGDEVLIPVELVVKMRALLQQLQWRDVREELPPVNETVLVHGGIAYFNRLSGQWMSLTANDYPGKPITWDVTHWMHVPQPPHNVEEGK